MKKLDDVPFEKFSDGRIINNNVNRKHIYDLLNDKGLGFWKTAYRNPSRLGAQVREDQVENNIEE